MERNAGPKYLETHQEEFRRCLEWLSKGSETNFWELEDEFEKEFKDDPDDKFGNEWFEFHRRMGEQWKQQAEVKFLQKHGLHDAGIILKPYFQEGAFFSGIELGQRKPKDPLDPLCGYLISLLMWDGTVGVCRCAYKKCRKFNRPRTARKMFCSNLCRAKAYMDKKSPETKNKYMREWRANRARLRRAKKNAARNVVRLQIRRSTKSQPRPV